MMYVFVFQLQCFCQYCTTAELVNLNLVKVCLFDHEDLGAKMTESPEGTRNVLRPGGAGSQGGGDRGKIPAPANGKAKGKLHCVLCQIMPDHYATEFPYNVGQ